MLYTFQKFNKGKFNSSPLFGIILMMLLALYLFVFEYDMAFDSLYEIMSGSCVVQYPFYMKEGTGQSEIR